MQIIPRVMLGILKCAINDSVVLHFAKGLQNRMASRESNGIQRIEWHPENRMASRESNGIQRIEWHPEMNALEFSLSLQSKLFTKKGTDVMFHLWSTGMSLIFISERTRKVLMS